MFFHYNDFSAPLPPELLDLPDEFIDHSASDGTIEENFEEELARAPEVYAEVRTYVTLATIGPAGSCRERRRFNAVYTPAQRMLTKIFVVLAGSLISS